MTCDACGADMVTLVKDLPFKVREPATVIVKGVPVQQCPRCPQYRLAPPVLARVVQLLAGVNPGREFAIVTYEAN